MYCYGTKISETKTTLPYFAQKSIILEEKVKERKQVLPEGIHWSIRLMLKVQAIILKYTHTIKIKCHARLFT